MAYSQADIDALQEAIATGALRVKFGSGADSREVEYRSLAEMKNILADMTDSLNPNPTPVPRASYVQHCRE